MPNVPDNMKGGGNQAEEAIERLAAIVTYSDDAIIGKDLDGIITSWNRGAEKLFGYASEEIVGKPVTILIPEDHIDEEPHILGRIRRGEVIEHYETVRKRKDDRLLNISLTVSPLKDGSGHIIGASKIARDITERKRSEETLRESEERFRQLFEMAPVAVYSCNAEGRIESFNDRAAELWGRTPEKGEIDELFCGSFKMFRPDGTFLAHKKGAMAAVLSGDITEYRDGEVHIERHDGSRIVVLMTIRSLKDRNGTITGAINCFYDITERKRSEEVTRESEERFRTLADNIAQFAWIADASGKIYWYNRRWYDYTGTTPELMAESGWKAVCQPEHLERVTRGIGHALEMGRPWEDTFPLRGKDGIYRWFLSQLRPIRDEEGNLLRWFGTNTDITEQLEMANQLRQYAADLSEADRRKNEFLAMLAHELRNPLAPIRNAVQLLSLEGSDDIELQWGRDVIDRQSAHLTRLIDDLLDVSRISRGKIELRKGSVELASVVNHAAEAARALYKSMNHELTVTLPSKPIYVHGDPARLAQVVGNLLNNACKFTDKGGHIWLKAEQEDNDAVIRVLDTGIGISPEQFPRIFEMFTQVDTTLERSRDGLGIGLMLVKNIVELHGGTVGVNSAGLGQGSEFVVRLPKIVEMPTPVAPDPVVNTGLPAMARRILVVDDNSDSASSLALWLKLTGNETEIAYDGFEAVEAATVFRPDAVLLDIGLPKLNGYEVARKIRDEPWGKEIVLIALTGWGQEEDRQKSRDAGFNAHMIKPVDFDALMKLLASLTPNTESRPNERGSKPLTSQS